MRLIITCSDGLVAVVEHYQGPVPRVGESVHHPRESQPVPGLSDDFMTVKGVSWGIVARPGTRRVRHFTGADDPFVEVFV